MSNKTASKLFIVRNSKCRGCIIEAITYLINSGKSLAELIKDLPPARVDYLLQKKILSPQDIE